MELIDRLNEIRRKADKQLDAELLELRNGLKGTTWNSVEEESKVRLVNAALNLRELPEGVVACDLNDIFFTADGNKSQLWMLKRIVDRNNFASVPADLDALIDCVLYNVLDDGYMRLLRVELEYEFPPAPYASKTFRAVHYFLTNDEWIDLDALAGRFKSGDVFTFVSGVAGIKSMRFGDVDKFSAFLEILGDRDNWDVEDPYRDRLAGKLDELMRPENFDDWQVQKVEKE